MTITCIGCDGYNSETCDDCNGTGVMEVAE